MKWKWKQKINQILSGTFDCSDNRRKKVCTGDVVWNKIASRRDPNYEHVSEINRV
jgi:hypothetical protein